MILSSASMSPALILGAKACSSAILRGSMLYSSDKNRDSELRSLFKMVRLRAVLVPR